MLYKSHTSPSSLYLGDKETIADLRNRGVKCFSHQPAYKWTHHEKIVAIDGEIAFLGGIDLTEGRWDSHDHRLLDRDSLHERGDYYNSTLPSKTFRRDKDPRLPWHDVHCRIEGPAAFDIAAHFVERWNTNKRESDSVASSYDELSLEKSLSGGGGNHHVQILRSISKNTGANNGRTERSISEGYVGAIRSAERFIYIENQYFISNHGAGPVVNPIMPVLAERLEKAISSKQKFVLILVHPVIPEGGTLSAWTQQEQMYWQFRTLKRDRDHRLKPLDRVMPLWRRVERAAKKAAVAPNDYLSIHYLRGWAQKNGTLFTEQVYPHVKLMIVDDRVVIMGSANINDRSMVGDRDSEIVAMIWDPATVEPPPVKGFSVARFAHELRLALWKEHLGLKDEQFNLIRDPIDAHAYWKGVSRLNTAAFLQAFTFLPAA